MCTCAPLPLLALGTNRALPPTPAQVDAIGGARFDDGAGGDNEVQRTMLEIVNQLDGFDARGNVKVRRPWCCCRRYCFCSLLHICSGPSAYAPCLPPHCLLVQTAPPLLAPSTHRFSWRPTDQTHSTRLC